ncbi:hypothetical protein CUM97_08540 [Enterococcus mundtii]|nr:hypothetical protein CUM97_08540 [Enterococcus mundtii]
MSGQNCSASRNKTPSTKIVLQIFVDGALFFRRGYFCSRRLFGYRCGENECPTPFFSTCVSR